MTSGSEGHLLKMVITLTVVKGTQRLPASFCWGGGGEKREKDFLGTKAGFDLEIGQRIELGFGDFLA